MIDLQRLKDSVDLRLLVEADLGSPPSRGSKAWTWRCPFHAEQRGHSLAVWRDGWRCFGACATGGDAISWLQHYRKLDFKNALRALGASESEVVGVKSGLLRPGRETVPAGMNTVTFKPFPRHEAITSDDPPPSRWQAAALRIVEEAEAALWQPDGTRALAYLRERRGLAPETIRAARLGLVAGHYRTWRTLHGLSVPCGILIPWLAGGALWGVKVRRAAGSCRYEQMPGGRLAGGLNWADHMVPGRPALVAEGEFNCLTAWQAARALICPVSPGSASARIAPRWYPFLAAAPVILACYDADEAGQRALERLRALSARVIPIAVLEGKDINEFFLRRGQEERAIRDLIRQALLPLLSIE